MNCATCGTDLDTRARYCSRCGEPVQPCPKCGVAVDDEFDFCPACGTPMSSAAEPIKERKVVTVLFADLVGFTAHAEQLDPEDVRAMLDSYQRHLREQLEGHGGTVEKFIGDAVVALFGAPIAHEDDPERAVRAALTIRDGIVALNKAENDLDLRIRIAVNTGEAFVVVSARPGEGMATGDVVNTAARLQAAAPTNGVLVGERTYLATREAIEYRPHESVRAKGKREPVRAWEVLAARGTADGDARRADTPLVGRERELQLLGDARTSAARDQTAALVTLVGIPGIGKSRLVFELYAALDASGDPIARLQGRCPPYGNRAAFSALAEMIKSWAGILSTDATDAAARKLTAAVDELGLEEGQQRWVVRHLRPLAGLAFDTDPGVAGRGEAFAAWQTVFETLAERDGLVLVFEDLHWADDDLLDFVDQLVARAINVPLLVVATTRPELLDRRPDWGGGKRNAHTVSLSPLSEAETARLIAQRLGLSPSESVELSARIGGNPLFAEEYARMLAARRPGDEELPVPDTVQGIIAARLDALSPDEKALVHDAAILGQTFWIGALAHVGMSRPDQIEQILYALEQKEFVRRERRSTVADERQYAFRHVLVRDVAYSQIARSARAEKHRCAAEWIESLAADRAEDKAEMLAQHYLNGLKYARAAGLETGELEVGARKSFVDAGDRAASLNAHAAAVGFFAAALELSPEGEPARPALLLRLGQARFHAEQAGAAEFTEAREGLLANGDLELAATADVCLFSLLTAAGDRERAWSHLERAASLLRDAAPSRAKAQVLSQTARFLMGPGAEHRAIRTAREALEMADQLGLDDLRTQALSNIGFARVACGDTDGLADLEQGLAIAIETNSSESVRACRLLGATEQFLGDLPRGFELYEQARREALRFSDAFNTRWLEAARALEYYWTGRWEDAYAIADRFLTEATAGSRHYLEALCSHVRGEIALARGDLTRASADAAAAVAIGRIGRDSWLLYPSLAFAARVDVAAGRRSEAAALGDELLAAWEESHALVAYWVADLVVAFVVLGRGSDILALAGRGSHTTRWLEAACAFARGDAGTAGEIYREIGSRPDEAVARLAAAEQLTSEGRSAEGNAELEKALAFFREVHADAAIGAAPVSYPRRL